MNHCWIVKILLLCEDSAGFTDQHSLGYFKKGPFHEIGKRLRCFVLLALFDLFIYTYLLFSLTKILSSYVIYVGDTEQTKVKYTYKTYKQK